MGYDTTATCAHLISSIELDDTSSMPLYRQLASALREAIVSEELRVGDALPTEVALGKGLGIGISTVRAAYGLLVSEGIVSRHAGRGSFVAEPKLSRRLDGIYNFSSEIRRTGKIPSSRLVNFARVTPTPAITAKLKLAEGESAFEVCRLRLANDTIIMLETSYIPTKLCPGLSRDDVTGSLYDRVAKLSGSAPAEAHEIHEAVVVSATEAKLLERPAGSPAFLITRTTINGRGETMEYCTSIVPGDHTRYEMTLKPDTTIVTKLHA